MTPPSEQPSSSDSALQSRRRELLLVRLSLPPPVWRTRVTQAGRLAAKVERVFMWLGKGWTKTRALAKVFPNTPITTAQVWINHYQNQPGEPWERLIDRRLPGFKQPVPGSLNELIVTQRPVAPAARLRLLRSAARDLYGEELDLDEALIGEVLDRYEEASEPDLSGDEPGEELALHQGAGLALLVAAAALTGVARALAEALVSWRETLDLEEFAPNKVELLDRDGKGRFTSCYNTQRLAHHEDGIDPRFRSVDETRGERQTTPLTILECSLEVIERKLLALACVSLLSTRRGLAGLQGPSGEALAVLSPVAYQEATLDKFLRELKWIAADAVLWPVHAQTWEGLIEPADHEPWRQLVLYLDRTEDPWWTRFFARSTKVTRLGRVMPALSRVMVSSGAGVPVMIETGCGPQPLKTRAQELLSKLDQVLGAGMVGRITVIDSELNNYALWNEWSRSEPRRLFITVLKGGSARNKVLEEAGPSRPFRQRDHLREGRLTFTDRSRNEEFRLRAVEITRPSSRNPVQYFFVTNVPLELLAAEEIATCYLDRWPNQERVFREFRHGAGLEHSHGFGRKLVSHVALLTKRERAEARQARATKRRQQAEEQEQRSKQALERERQRLREAKRKRAAADELAVLEAQRAALKEACSAAEKVVNRERKSEQRAQQERDKLAAMPIEIYVKDVTLDSIMACLKAMLLGLVGVVCRQFLGQAMTLERFIDEFARLPVKVTRKREELIYEIELSKRNQRSGTLLARASEAINGQEIRYQGQLIRFSLRDPPS